MLISRFDPCGLRSQKYKRILTIKLRLLSNHFKIDCWDSSSSYSLYFSVMYRLRFSLDLFFTKSFVIKIDPFSDLLAPNLATFKYFTAEFCHSCIISSNERTSKLGRANYAYPWLFDSFANYKSTLGRFYLRPATLDICIHFKTDLKEINFDNILNFIFDLNSDFNQIYNN